MNIEIIIQDAETKVIQEISNIVASTEYKTEISGSPGTLNFSYLKGYIDSLSMGSTVSFKVDGTGVFFGYVFSIDISKEETIDIVAYDQIRYLKNKQTYLFKPTLASEIFQKICIDFGLNYKVLTPSYTTVYGKIYDNKSLYEIIQSALDDTLILSKQRYIIRDNFGTLEFVHVDALKTNYVYGDMSQTTDYNYSEDIDSDTYNQVKLEHEDKEKEHRSYYIAKDSENISKWGILQFFDKVAEELNGEQIQSRAYDFLLMKNRTTKKLSLDCIGNIEINAGNGIIIDIEDIVNKKYFLVTSCTHTFENDKHTMSLELEIF
jgi:hypothetical protein